MSPAPGSAVAVALTGVAVLAGGLHYVSSTTSAEGAGRPFEQGGTPVTATASTAAGELYPGGALMGSLLLSSTGRAPVEVTSASFEPATTTTDGCRTTGVAFASTFEASDAAPLRVPAGGGGSGPVTPLGWTAFLALDADDACQGATFRSALVLDGARVATVIARAGVLAAPGAPVSGPTTPTRAAISWPAAPALPTAQSTTTVAYAVERAPAGTSAWSPACGTTATAPLPGLSCTDTGLAPATAYAYRVTSVLGSWRAVGPTGPEVRTGPAPRG